MTTLIAALEQLGNLHDAKVMSILWDVQAERLEFVFDDIYANFSGLEDYPGKVQGSIVLSHVSELVVDVISAEQLYVYEFAVEEFEGCFLATVLFRASGKMTAKFTSAEFPEVHLPVVKGSDHE